MKPIGIFVCSAPKSIDAKQQLLLEIIGSSNSLSTMFLSKKEALKLVSEIILILENLED